MEDIVLFKESWKWLLSESHCYSVAAVKAGKTVAISVLHHWPSVCHLCSRLVNLLSWFLIQWKDCLIRGSRSFFGLGSAALLVIIWSCFLTLTSLSCVLAVVLTMVSFFFTLC